MVIELCASLSSPPPSSSSRFSFSSSSCSTTHSLPSTSPPDTCSDFSNMFDFLLAPSTTNGSSSPSTTATLSSSTSPHYSRFSTLAAEMEADHRVGSAGILSSSPNLLSSSARNATFGSSSAPAEVERKRAMLNLSISKIQTINTSHAPISLRKSVLIYNTLKCLQRELSESSERDDVLGSLMEADEAVSAPTNVSSSEAMDVKDVAEAISEPMDDEADGEHQWNRDATPKKTIDMADAESEEDMDISTSPQQQHLFYDDLFCSSQWSPYRYDSSGWNYLSSTSSSNGGGFGGGLASSSSGQSASAASSSFFSSGSFIEDYLSVWGGFENESDSLQHHNLSQVDIMHMFGSPRSPHQHQLNNELISQA